MKTNCSKLCLVGTFVYNDAYALFNLTNEINKYRFYLPVWLYIEYNYTNLKTDLPAKL